MLNYRYLPTVSTLLLVVLFLSGCAAKKPLGPPQELLDQIAGVERTYDSLAPLSPSADESAAYLAAIQASKDALEQSNYSLSAEKAKLAKLEVNRLAGTLYFRQLEQFNPDPPLTYHYRQQVKISEEAQAAGKIDEAIAAAEEAKKQVQLTLTMLKQCLEDSEKELGVIKGEIEQLYRPGFDLIQLYWAAVASLPERNCDKTRNLIAQLKSRVKSYRDNTVVMNTNFIVSAPPEFVRIYGDPIMFQEVTPDGLKTRLARVPVGTKVNFIRSNLAAPGKTYYYVEDPNSGSKGWMAEERVWPERAAQQKARP